MKNWMPLLFMAVGAAGAAPNADALAICYAFSGDKVNQKGPCVVASGYGAGGSYRAITFQNKEYVIESTTEMLPSGAMRTLSTTINGTKGIEYVRDARWYNIIKGNLYPNMDYLYCTKTPNGKTDICVKYPE